MRTLVTVMFGVLVGALSAANHAAATLGNDLIANAVVVLDTPFTYQFDTSTYNAATDMSDPEVDCAPFAEDFERQSHTAWFTFVPVTAGEFRASTAGTTEVRTVLALWTATSVGTLDGLVACNWVTQANVPSPLLTHSDIPANPASPGPALQAGQRYYLEVMSVQGSDGGEITLSVDYSGLLAPRPLPVLSGLAPGGAPTDSDALEVTISGSGFSEATAVQFGTASLVPHTVSPGMLTVTVPAEQFEVEANIQVTLSNPEPGGGTSAPAIFTVYPRPAVVATEPTSILVGSPGTTLYVVGSGFRDGISQATAGGVPRAMTVTGPTTADIALLAADVAAPGPLSIVITNATGGGEPVSSEPAVLVVRDRLDIDCSGTISSDDALRLLRFQAGLVQALPGCPLALEPGEMMRSVLNIRRIVAGLERLP